MTAGGRRGGRRGSRGASGPKPGDVVLEAGAVAAVLSERPGHKWVEARLAAPGTAVIDAVSLLEAMVALSERGLSPVELQEVVDALALRVEAVDEDLARRAVEVASEDGTGELSLAQLLCVALGRRLGVPILAVDSDLEGLDGVEEASPQLAGGGGS